MDAYGALTYVVLGSFLGAVGQGARAIIGIKKEFETASLSQKEWKDWFDLKELMLSLMIGAIAGSFGAVLLLGSAIDREFLLTLIAAGYAGADFIEGFMKARVPK